MAFLDTVASRLRPAPFDPAQTSFRLDGLASVVAETISNRLTRIGFDYTFLPSIGKWRAVKFNNAGDRNVTISVRLFECTGEECVVECIRRFGDRNMFMKSFYRLQSDDEANQPILDATEPDIEDSGEDSGEDSEDEYSSGLGYSPLIYDYNTHNANAAFSEGEHPDIRIYSLEYLINNREWDRAIEAIKLFIASPNENLRCYGVSRVEILAQHSRKVLELVPTIEHLRDDPYREIQRRAMRVLCSPALLRSTI